MALLEVTVEEDEVTGEDFLLLRFTNGTVAFQCPVGEETATALKAFKEFIDMAEDVMHENITVH